MAAVNSKRFHALVIPPVSYVHSEMKQLCCMPELHVQNFFCFFTPTSCHDAWVALEKACNLATNLKIARLEQLYQDYSNIIPHEQLPSECSGLYVK